MSFAFDEAYYLKSKLQQLIKTDAATYGSWSTSDVKDAIEAAGMTVEGHYQQYSLVEGTSANPYFNTTEYLEAKLAQLKSVDPAQYNNWSVDDVVKAFQDAGLTAEEHYQMYGCKETDANGYLINPSNAFDANAYVQAKLAQLVAADPETYGEWTAEDVVEAIADAGLTPVEHFEEYGKAEGQAAGIDMVQTVPVTQRVANDDLRDGMNENVPSNYNKPVDAPKDVTATEAAENGGVDKPCDMATASKPADPVATPADSNYVAVPGGGITDTNENPVELVTAEVKDTEGNTVATASEYGVASTTTDASGNTVKTVQPVDENGAVDTKADPIQTVTTSADGKTQTTETKVTDAQGNSVEVAEKVTTADDGSTVTDTVATATDADGNQTAKTETRVAADADGEVTGTNTSYTDESGKTSTDSTGEDPGTPDSPTPTPEPTPADSGSGATADTTAPMLTGVTVNGKEVAVTFNEKVVEIDSGTTADNVFVTADGNDPTTGNEVSSLTAPDAKLSADGKSYTFTLNDAPAAGQVVKVVIGNNVFQDTSLNVMPTNDIPVASDPVPASQADMVATFESTVLTFAGTDSGTVAIDVGQAKVTGEKVQVQDGSGNEMAADAVTAAFGTMKGINTSAAQAQKFTVACDATNGETLTVTSSSLTPVEVTLAAGSDKLTFVGDAANATVQGDLSNGDTLAGNFTKGSGTVTNGKIGYTETGKVVELSTSDGTAGDAVFGNFTLSGTKLNVTGTTVVVDASKTALADFTQLEVGTGNTVKLGADALNMFTNETGGAVANNGTINVTTGAGITIAADAGTVSLGTLAFDLAASITANKTAAIDALTTKAGQNVTLAAGENATLTVTKIGGDGDALGQLTIGEGKGTVTISGFGSNTTVASFTGNDQANELAFTLSRTGNVVDAGAGKDNLTITLKEDAAPTVIDMGAGQDTLTLKTHTKGSAEIKLAAGTTAGDNADTITGFVAAKDTIDLGSIAHATATAVANLGSASDQTLERDITIVAAGKALDASTYNPVTELFGDTGTHFTATGGLTDTTTTKVLVATGSGGNSLIYLVKGADSDSDETVDTVEVDLIGVTDAELTAASFGITAGN